MQARILTGAKAKPRKSPKTDARESALERKTEIVESVLVRKTAITTQGGTDETGTMIVIAIATVAETVETGIVMTGGTMIATIDEGEDETIEDLLANGMATVLLPWIILLQEVPEETVAVLQTGEVAHPLVKVTTDHL